MIDTTYSGRTGLTTAEAAALFRSVGPNIVFPKQRFRPVIAFIKKFNSPLLIILIVASVISFLVGQPINGAILLGMVALSAILEFINTYKSERAVEELLSRVVTSANVVRDGVAREIDLRQIVPGDIIQLSAGDIIPADCRVLEARDFFVNQSALTGESFPVEKFPLLDEPASWQVDNGGLTFMGTSVVTGYATVVAVHTGPRTEFGKIGATLAKSEPPSAFEVSIRQFSYFVMRLTSVMVAVVFLLNAVSGKGWFSSFLFAVAIAIGLTPELLPVIITVCLSRGSVRMARRGAIVKNLSAIQNFGSMNVLCTDKTGTLTENRIVMVRHVDILGRDSDEVLKHAYWNSYFHTGVANPLDTAVVTYRQLDLADATKIDEVPFDFTRRRTSVVVKTNGARLLVTKGAPESVFEACQFYRDADGERPIDAACRTAIEDKFRDLSAEGFRVLGVAVKIVPPSETVYSVADEIGMTFLGFVSFLDPPKAGARESVDSLEELGIEMKILTGDNELLTRKICRDLDIKLKGTLVGADIDALNDHELIAATKNNTVFARVTPEQKERIIRALKAGGNSVGYLGDGINDAPALKAADAGVSVDNAVDVAKETADIILINKSLDVLRDGVMEGRRTFHNTQKYILMGLSSNFGNMFSMMAASAFLPFLPMLPTQVLLNNFLYDTSQLSLPSDQVDDEDVRRPPCWDIGFIKRYMLTFGSISSLFDFLTFGVLFWGFRLSESQFQTGWFIESIATQVFVIYVIRTKKIPFLQSRPSLLLFVNTFCVVAVAWIISVLPLGRYFGFAPLPWPVLATLLGLVLVYLALVQATKIIFYRRMARRATSVDC